MTFVRNDGGRAEAGFKGSAGDCGVRAVAIATGRPYREVYDELWEFNREFASGRSRKAKKAAKNTSPRDGLFPEVLSAFFASIGWEWVPTMGIGTGCKVHLRADELPDGPLVCRVSRHYVAVLNGVVHDTHDPTRDGTRCVYGYWRPA